MCRADMYDAPPWARRGKRGRGSRMHPGHGGPRSRARKWMYENPSPDEIIEMLEEHQRDLEQEVANIASRIKHMKEATTASDA